jgi:hypothetical protein
VLLDGEENIAATCDSIGDDCDTPFDFLDGINMKATRPMIAAMITVVST